MNKRELMIIVVAVFIGIYGLLDYFVFSAKSVDGEDAKMAAAIGRITTLAESAGIELSTVTAKKDIQNLSYVITKAETNWKNDPFAVYTADTLKVDDAVSAEKLPELSFTGFIQAGRKILAVVNGMEYTIGEMLKDVGYKVFSITPSRVVLLTEANKEIILQLEEN